MYGYLTFDLKHEDLMKMYYTISIVLFKTLNEDNLTAEGYSLKQLEKMA